MTPNDETHHLHYDDERFKTTQRAAIESIERIQRRQHEDADRGAAELIVRVLVTLCVMALVAVIFITLPPKP